MVSSIPDKYNELFDIAEIANFSPTEQQSYQNSLKYYRDLNNVVDTARQEGLKTGLEAGRQEGLEAGRQEGVEQTLALILDRQRSLLLRLLPRTIGPLPDHLKTQINQLPLPRLEALNETFLDFTTLNDLATWLAQPPNTPEAEP